MAPSIDVAGLGKLVVDIDYGGNFYAVVEPQDAWKGLDGMTAADIIDLSRKLRDALAAICDPVQPEDERIGGLHHAL
ncbi:proline racemase family protein, partial [Rhizobium leguminosarum]|uniref:proline racemase family protein n=1 Tax=Rhizobium leguminosarum TaxID=384 RepID=UPI003F9969C4